MPNLATGASPRRDHVAALAGREATKIGDDHRRQEACEVSSSGRRSLSVPGLVATLSPVVLVAATRCPDEVIA
jgi:hypothetical protein